MFSNAISSPTVRNTWATAGARSTRRTISRSIAAASAKATPNANGDPISGSRPSKAQANQATYMPIITNCAWAKLTMPITPNTSVSPSEMTAYTPPIRIPSTIAWIIARSGLLAPPQRAALGDLLRPHRHQFVRAPLDHHRKGELVQALLVELHRAPGHGACPSLGELLAGEHAAEIRGFLRPGLLHGLRQHVHRHRMLQRLVDHEVAEALAESLGELGREIVIGRSDGQHAFGEFTQAFLEIGDDVTGRAAHRGCVQPLLPHGADDEQAVVEIGDREGHLG